MSHRRRSLGALSLSLSLARLPVRDDRRPRVDHYDQPLVNPFLGAEGSHRTTRYFPQTFWPTAFSHSTSQVWRRRCLAKGRRHHHDSAPRPLVFFQFVASWCRRMWLDKGHIVARLVFCCRRRGCSLCVATVCHGKICPRQKTVVWEWESDPQHWRGKFGLARGPLLAL